MVVSGEVGGTKNSADEAAVVGRGERFALAGAQQHSGSVDQLCAEEAGGDREERAVEVVVPGLGNALEGVAHGLLLRWVEVVLVTVVLGRCPSRRQHGRGPGLEVVASVPEGRETDREAERSV